MTHLEKLQANGIRRTGDPKRGFTYRHADGRPIDAEDLARIETLKIPPAWTDVMIHPSSQGKLQAIGRDKAGRWQYRYHPAFRERRESAKYARLVRFAEALPRMRSRISRDLSRRALDRDKVMACILKILSACFIRPGSQVYADEHGAFGLATLRPEHVTVRGDRVEFNFRGKSQQFQHRELRDRQVATTVRRMLEIPGNEVFKFINEDGDVVDVKRRHINAYIKEVMGHSFSAKDFRTWAGTLICASALARVGFDDNDSQRLRKRKLNAAVKETAEALGNTPAVCRKSYIYPSILEHYQRGRVVEKYFASAAELAEARSLQLRAPERSLVDLLREETREHAHRADTAARRMARPIESRRRDAARARGGGTSRTMRAGGERSAARASPRQLDA